jgi:hypothetical protein
MSSKVIFHYILRWSLSPGQLQLILHDNSFIDVNVYTKLVTGVNEHAYFGTLVMTISATDADPPGTDHSTVTYGLDASTSPQFAIHERTGEPMHLVVSAVMDDIMVCEFKHTRVHPSIQTYEYTNSYKYNKNNSKFRMLHCSKQHTIL